MIENWDVSLIKKKLAFWFLPMVLVTLSVAISPLKADELTRADSQGNVQASITLLSPQDLVSLEVEALAFEVYLDTHSVNLSAYQMEKLSYLRDDSGKEYPALGWEPISESSHHRSGILKFSNLDDQGNTIISSSSKFTPLDSKHLTGFMELVIRGLAGVEERVFRWDLPARSAEAKELEKGNLTIDWLGHASFLITSKDGLRVITDPYDRSVGYKVPLPEADIVLVSHQHFDHNATEEVQGSPRIIRGTGEHKVNGFTFLGIPSFHDEIGGAKRGENTIFTWEMNGIKIAHLGDLGHPLTEKQMPYLKDVDILFIPVGGYFTIDYRVATQIVKQISPRVVVPMHYKTEALGSGFPIDGVEKFLADKGNIQQISSSRLKVTEDLLKEKTKIVVLQFR